MAIRLVRNDYYPVFLSLPSQLEQIAVYYPDGVVLVGCVDNHPARRNMELFVGASSRSVYYVDCANEATHGEVIAVYVAYAAMRQARRGALRSEIDPRVLTDQTGDPTKASCNQQLDAGNVQV